MKKSELRQIIKEEIEKILLSSPKLLFPKWKKGELSVGNDDVYGIKTPEDLDNMNKTAFNTYVKLVNKYPNINKDDLSIVNSIGLNGGDDFDNYEFKDKKLNNDLFKQILKDEYDFDIEED